MNWKAVPSGVPHLRVTGALSFLFGIISLGINASAYNSLSNFKPGAWWASMFVVISGVLGTVSLNSAVVVATCIFSTFSVFIMLIGSVVDGLSSTFIHSLEACSWIGTSSSTSGADQTCGNSDYFLAATDCLDSNYLKNYDCYCATKQDSCHGLSGVDKCNDILTSFDASLQAAVSFDVLSLACVLSLAIVTCCSLCCPFNFRGDDDRRPPLALGPVASSPGAQRGGGGGGGGGGAGGSGGRGGVYVQAPSSPNPAAERSSLPFGSGGMPNSLIAFEDESVATSL